MRYRNPKSGLDITLGDLDADRRHFFEVAGGKFRENTNWFELEAFGCSPVSPIFGNANLRAAVLNRPLLQALSGMWLQLGIDQSFAIAHDFASADTRSHSSDVAIRAATGEDLE